MRRNIVHPGADELIYEIRQIVGVGKQLEKLGIPITWENIGDPIQKGEHVASWIKEIVSNLVQKDITWAYTATQGAENTRNFLAQKVNERGGAQISPDDILIVSKPNLFKRFKLSISKAVDKNLMPTSSEYLIKTL